MRINELLLEDQELDEISALGAGTKVGRFGGNVVQGTKDFFTGIKQGYKQARTGQPTSQPTAPAGQASQPAPQASASSAAGQASQPTAQAQPQRQDLGFGFNGQTGEPFKSADERAEYFKQQGVQDPGYKGTGKPAADQQSQPAAQQATDQQSQPAAQPAASSTPQPGKEIEFPGSNVKFTYSAQWLTPDGKPASEPAEKVLTQLATGVSPADLNINDITSARRNLYKGAPGMTENKKVNVYSKFLNMTI